MSNIKILGGHEKPASWDGVAFLVANSRQFSHELLKISCRQMGSVVGLSSSSFDLFIYSSSENVGINERQRGPRARCERQ